MKKIILFFSVVLLLIGTAISVSADNAFLWSYERYGDGVVITGYNGTQTDVYIPSYITEGEVEYPVLKLDDKLFYGNTAINSVTLGSGIEEIGESTFEGASNLVCIVTNNELNAIGDRAFYGCASFNSIILYDAVTSIADNAFVGCDKLTIWCNESQTAYDYAVEKGIKYEILNPDAEPEIYTYESITYYIFNGEAIAVSADTSVNNVVLPSVIEGYPVTELRETFRDHTTLVSVSLPNTLKAIGDYSFCNCTALIEVTIPDSVNKIGSYAFSNCTVLTDIDIPDSITDIGAYTFTDCKNLKNVTLSKSLTVINEGLFRQCKNLVDISLPDGITNIGKFAFSQCESLKNVVIPTGVINIEREAFYSCDNLETVTMANSVISLGTRAFASCENLTTVVSSQNLESIGNETFDYCYKLSCPINISDSVISIGTNAFSCNAVLAVNENSYAHTYAVNNNLLYYINKNNSEPEFYTVTGVKYYINNGEAVAVLFDGSVDTVEIPFSVGGYPVTEIRAAFRNHSSLISVSLPETLKIIGDRSFENCTILESIDIPENVLSVGKFAFSECDSIKKIDIPASVSSIEKYAFYQCGNISEVVFYGDTIYIGDLAFSGLSSLTEVTIPKNATFGFLTFGSCGKLTTVIFEEGSTVIGSEMFSSCGSLKNITIPETMIEIKSNAFFNCPALNNISIPVGVKKIGSQAFSRCTNLTSIIIPDSVTTIGDSAFAYCTALVSVSLPAELEEIPSKLFLNCKELNNVNIPESVISIGKSAFETCESLLVLTIPDSVATMYTSSFPANTILAVKEDSQAHTFAVDNNLLCYVMMGEEQIKIYVVDGITYLIDNGEAVAVDFDGSNTTVEIPETIYDFPVTRLVGTFREQPNLLTVILPDSLKAIDKETFYFCTGLTNLTIPDGVTFIGDKAFYWCYNLSDINIPDNVNYIGKYAFRYCIKLKKQIVIPETVTSIENFAFQESGITGVIIPDTVTEIKYGAFERTSIRNISIPNNVSSIAGGVFSSCKFLSDVKLPDGLTTIERALFEDCISLENIKIPENVTSIKENAFSGCVALKNIVIPENVTTIKENAFSGCVVLKNIVIPKSVTLIEDGAFPSNIILIVHENSYAHTYAVENDLLYFILRKGENPEISYGVGITGTVTYTDGTPVSEATVEIIYGDGTVKESVITDENGVYEFTYAEVGRYTLKASDSENRSSSEIVSIKRMNVFDVFMTGETDLILKKSYNISGTATGSDDISVLLTDIDGNVIASAKTIDSGFTFVNIPNGTYILKAESDVGYKTMEITVFNSDVTGLDITIEAQSASISGYVEVEDREFKHHRRNWVHITLYNSEGVAVAQAKSDGDGRYTFTNLALDEYTIVAETSEMRPDKHKHFDRSHTLIGYAYVDVCEEIAYEAETIVLYEENDYLSTISGKVTANGEHQACEVILTNVFRHEISRITTNKNGKYSFTNVRDGMYFITAVTENKGMGFAVVVVRNGEVFGDTDIKVLKSSRVSAHEEIMNSIPECTGRDDAMKHKDKIIAEKKFYDSLPEKEKKHFSKEYKERLNKLSEWISCCEYTENGGKMEKGGMVVSGEEMEKEDKVELILNITKHDGHTVPDDGIKTSDDYIQQSVEDCAGDRNLIGYYDITLSKSVNGTEHKIESICRDTDTTGKIRITMEIPEEERGHKHYSFVHVHNGETTTLVDLDDNPDTITFEVDRFSTFALAYTDEDLASALLLGDVNNDGVVNAKDIVFLRKYITGGYDIKIYMEASDTNMDGIVNAKDIIYLRKYVTGGYDVELN